MDSFRSWKWPRDILSFRCFYWVTFPGFSEKIYFFCLEWIFVGRVDRAICGAFRLPACDVKTFDQTQVSGKCHCVNFTSRWTFNSTIALNSFIAWDTKRQLVIQQYENTALKEKEKTAQTHIHVFTYISDPSTQNNSLRR